MTDSLMTVLAEKTVRDGHTFGFTVVEDEQIVSANAPFQEFVDAIAERARALNVVLTITYDRLRYRYELTWRPCRGTEQPTVSTVV